MSTVVVKFNLEKDEDREAYKTMNQAEGMKSVLQDLSGLYDSHPISFRALLKYADLSDKEYEIVEKISERFYSLLGEYKVDLD